MPRNAAKSPRGTPGHRLRDRLRGLSAVNSMLAPEEALVTACTHHPSTLCGKHAFDLYISCQLSVVDKKMMYKCAVGVRGGGCITVRSVHVQTHAGPSQDWKCDCSAKTLNPKPKTFSTIERVGFLIICSTPFSESCDYMHRCSTFRRWQKGFCYCRLRTKVSSCNRSLKCSQASALGRWHLVSGHGSDNGTSRRTVMAAAGLHLPAVGRILLCSAQFSELQGQGRGGAA